MEVWTQRVPYKVNLMPFGRHLLCTWPVAFILPWTSEKWNLFLKWFCITGAATWQNQQNHCAPSKDSDQPGHPPSQFRVFTVRKKKAWVLSYPLSAQRRLIRQGGYRGWSESSLGAQPFCWFCLVAAHMMFYCGLSTLPKLRTFSD